MSGDPRPKRRWPGGAEAVVCITIHVDGPCVQIGRGIEPLGIHSTGCYAMRRGVPRYLDMLDRLGVPATFFVCGHHAEHYPELISVILQAVSTSRLNKGHERIWATRLQAHSRLSGSKTARSAQKVRLQATPDVVGRQMLGRKPLVESDSP